jgi:hypothetical protein
MDILENLLSVSDILQSVDLNEERRCSSAMCVNNEETKIADKLKEGMQLRGGELQQV